MDNYILNEGLILTDDEEDELSVRDIKINIKPTWKWLLNLP